MNFSREKMYSNWQSVAEQTGIFAGKGGFDVTVDDHTQLNGAVIGSTAAAAPQAARCWATWPVRCWQASTAAAAPRQ